MNTWIKTSDRLPTKEDGIVWVHTKPRSYPVLVRWDTATTELDEYWMRAEIVRPELPKD